MKRFRVSRIALIVSLSLNCLFVGVVAGSFLRSDDSRHMDLSFGPLAAALSDGDRSSVGRRLMRRGGLPHAREMRAERAAFVEALRAEPFEPSAIADLMNTQHQRGAAVFEDVRDALLERLTAMSAQERAALAERFEKSARRPPRR